jgi:hypothetical protein
MTGDREKTAAEIRAIVAAFAVAGDAVVTLQKEGRNPVRLRLDELLNGLEHPMPERQITLFEDAATGRNRFDPK